MIVFIKSIISWPKAVNSEITIKRPIPSPIEMELIVTIAITYKGMSGPFKDLFISISGVYYRTTIV